MSKPVGNTRKHRKRSANAKHSIRKSKSPVHATDDEKSAITLEQNQPSPLRVRYRKRDEFDTSGGEEFESQFSFDTEPNTPPTMAASADHPKHSDLEVTRELQKADIILEVRNAEQAKEQVSKWIAELKQGVTSPEDFAISFDLRDAAWKILSTYDLWPQWRFEVTRRLIRDKYATASLSLINLCFQAIIKSLANGHPIDEASYKLAKNLLNASVFFSQVNYSCKVLLTTAKPFTNATVKFLEISQLHFNKLQQDVDKHRILVLVRSCYKLLLISSETSNVLVKEAFDKMIEICEKEIISHDDEECIFFASVRLRRLGRTLDLESVYAPKIFPIQVKFLKQSLEKNDVLSTEWALEVLGGQAMLLKDDGKEQFFQQQTYLKTLVQLAMKQLARYRIKAVRFGKYLLEKALLEDDQPPAGDDARFASNETLKDNYEEFGRETKLRTDFLEKLYKLSPASLVCYESANVLELLVGAKTQFREQLINNDQWRQAYEKAMLQTNFAEVSLNYLKLLLRGNIVDEQLSSEMAMNICTLVWNLADAFESLRIKLCDSGWVDFLLSELKDVEQVKAKIQQDEFWYKFLIKNALSILYNISRSPYAKRFFLAKNAVEILVSYLDETYNKTIQVSLCIAYTVSDTPEAARLADERGIIKRLMEMTVRAVENTKERSAATSEGAVFWLSELFDALSLLAKNDSNKKKLMDCDVLGLVELIFKSERTEDKLMGLDLLWTLCFDSSIREQVVSKRDSGIIQPLKSFAEQQQDAELREQALKVVAFIEKWNSIANQQPQSASKAQKTGHIFISYSWKQQETALAIRKQLLANGFQVWMDVDRMHGGLLDAMAKAVEDALVVLLCFSTSYKVSNPCQAEAQYAYALGKPIVPVNMEYRYQADGWLGILVRPLKYVDMSLTKRNFETAFNELMKELGNVLPHEVSTDPPPNQGEHHSHGSLIAQPVANAQAKNEFSDVSAEDLLQRLREKFEMDETLVQKFSRFDGRKLNQLAKVRREAPDFFYQAVKEHFSVGNLPDLLQIFELLDEILPCSK